MSPRRYSRKEPPAACPFCKTEVPRPVFLTNDSTSDGVQGGRCPECDAIYLVDSNGKDGGTCLVAALTMLADGDQDLGMQLRVGVDYSLLDLEYMPRTHSIGKKRPKRFGVPKLWFAKRHDPPLDPSANTEPT